MKNTKFSHLLTSLLLLLIGCSSLPEGAQIRTINFSDKVASLEGELYLPSSKKPTAAVIVVHGGGWRYKSGDMVSICKLLVSQGIAAFNITYRLAPKHLYPKALIDVQDAIKWIQKNAAKYNIDNSRIGGWGYSAGAHLILRAGLDPSLGLSGIVAGGTPAKFDHWDESFIVNQFIGGPLKTHKEIWKEASPYYKVQKSSPPVFLYHGASDILVDPQQMELMKSALIAKNVEVETYKAPILGHVTTYLFSSKSKELGLEFLQKQFQ